MAITPRPVLVSEPFVDFQSWYNALTGIDVAKVQRFPTTGLATTASDTPDLHTHTSAGIIYTGNYLYHLLADKDDTHVVAATGLTRRDIIQISKYNFTGATTITPDISVFDSTIGGLVRVGVHTPGKDYVVGDVLTLVQAGASAGTVTVKEVDGDGGVLLVELRAGGTLYSVASDLSVTGGTGTLCKLNIEEITTYGQTVMTFNRYALMEKGYDPSYGTDTPAIKLGVDNIGLVLTANSTPGVYTYLTPGSVKVGSDTYTLATGNRNTHTLATAGNHKYDIVELKLSDGSVKVLAGSLVALAATPVVPTVEAGYIIVGTVYVDETSVANADIKQDNLVNYRTGDLVDVIVSSVENKMVIASASWENGTLTLVVNGDFATNSGVKFDVPFVTGIVSIKKGFEKATGAAVPLPDLGNISLAEVGTAVAPITDATSAITTAMIVDTRTVTWLARPDSMSVAETTAMETACANEVRTFISGVQTPINNTVKDMETIVQFNKDEMKTI